MIKENVLTALSALGFIPEEIKGFGYRFDYEGLTVVYSIDDEEAKCITLTAPMFLTSPMTTVSPCWRLWRNSAAR